MLMFTSMKTEETNTSETTKKKIINLLQKSKEYLWMSTGLYSSFYNDEDIKKAMVEAFERIKQVRIIIDGDAETKKAEVSWFFELAKRFKDKTQIRQSTGILHWMIADGKHFRLEKLHDLGVGINNLFVCDVEQPAISELLKSEFDIWWFAAKPVEL